MFNKLLNYFKNVWIIYFFLMLCLMEDKNFLVNLVFLNIFIFESLFQIFILYYFKKFLFFVIYFFFVLIKILCIFISVAFFTVAERKVLGAIHRRRGPNLVGFWGLLQPLADALKLFIKELIFPVKASRFIFLMAPFWILLLSVLGWVIIPFNSDLEDLTQWFMVKVYWYQYYFNLNDYANENFSRFKSLFSVDTSNGVIFLLAISSLNVYGIILAGWSSNSKYAFLGSLRSSAQMISYEVSLGLTILPVVLLANSLNLTDIVYMQQYSCIFLFPLFPCFLIFIISMLAETNRTPFDLPEAEAELVAGYNVEYSAITFAMFFLGEYSSMILMAAFCVIIFLGGWDAYEIRIFADKLIVICFFYILVRATFPRFRYDQLMQLCWKVFLPISLGYFLFVSSLVFVIVS